MREVLVALRTIAAAAWVRGMMVTLRWRKDRPVIVP